jgi:hypothetical protein
MFQGKPHSSPKYMPLWPKDKKTSWGPSTPCSIGSYPYSLDRPSTMGCYLNILKPLMTGEWSAKSFNSSSSSIICQTSTSESPIWRLNSEGYHRLNPHPREDWNSPILTISCLTFMSLAPPSPVEEGEIIMDTKGSGEAWSPSRWGHQV